MYTSDECLSNRNFLQVVFPPRQGSLRSLQTTNFNGSSDRQCGLCSRNCERQRCVRRNLLHIANFFWIAWNGSNDIGRKELGRPFWSHNLGRIGSNGIGSKSIYCLPRTWHFSRSTQVHSTQFRNGEDSTHGTGGRFDPFPFTHFFDLYIKAAIKKFHRSTA